ncbi:hypothetical protein BDY21DRAFT_372599 [Lineolata rhizophorae]|uniref:Uncharacterized protein n=1 Tax=Lineolata rhizophorae TaxID=578093 RepID=A0A6A6NYA6_9PEZI|nr:hypothetical protein BDY21DRAFT_372599 [Lineolata rhizophorae]
MSPTVAVAALGAQEWTRNHQDGQAGTNGRSALAYSSASEAASAALARVRVDCANAEHPTELRLTVFDALHALRFDSKLSFQVQRAVTKLLLEATTAADGYRFNERQTMDQKRLRGTRWRFVCRDSLHNRDRIANWKRSVTGKRSWRKEGDPRELTKGARPTYDRGGNIYMTFAGAENRIELRYRHLPIHQTNNQEQVAFTGNQNSIMVTPDAEQVQASYDASNGDDAAVKMPPTGQQ